jgi:hypothetical protein
VRDARSALRHEACSALRHEESLLPAGLAVAGEMRAAGLVFSHSVMERVSLLPIFSFMQKQYLRIMALAAPPRLSVMH